MLVSVSSVKGAPGVSSWALLAAAAWPHNGDRILVEADGSGGIIGARYELPVQPGSADLVSTLRRGFIHEGFGLEATGRLLMEPDEGRPGGLWAVPSPVAGRDVLASWSELAHPVADAMRNDWRLWIADCGRVWAGSPFELLLTTADLNIVISDDTVPSLVVLRSRVQAIPGTVAVLVVGQARHSEEELLGFTGADLLWKVPYFKSLAARAGQLSAGGGSARRSREWKTALHITHALARVLNGDAPMANDELVG